MSAALKFPRLNSILESNFAKSLGEPTDFPGERRYMFSLDNAGTSIVNEKTMPKILSLIEDIMGRKLDVRICEGAYTYENGTINQEVSFLVKVKPLKLLGKLDEYLRQNTRQESVLAIAKDGTAIMESLHASPSTQMTKEGYKVTSKILGRWMEVPEEVVAGFSAYTKIGNRWFVCVPFSIINAAKEMTKKLN
jgi:hypothetical protein